MRTPPRYLPALVTPFSRRGELDLDAHRHNLALLTGLGIRGFVLGGSTGEGPYLEPGERYRLAEASRSAGPSSFLLAGVAAETVRTALHQAAEAAEGGADAVLVLTPTSLVRGDHTAVGGFYEDVADGSTLPVFLYSVPRYTGYELPVETALHLAGHPRVAGIKDSGGNPVRLARLVAGMDGACFTGSSAAVTLSMAAGAYGAITASGNYLPGAVAGLVATARRSPRRAAPLQERLTTVAAQVERHGVPGVKAAARRAGLKPGYPRPPLRPLGPRRAAELRRAVGPGTDGDE